MNIYLEDGLYQVTVKYACFGFEVRSKRIVTAAPMFYAKNSTLISYWTRIAKRIN